MSSERRYSIDEALEIGNKLFSEWKEPLADSAFPPPDQPHPREITEAITAYRQYDQIDAPHSEGAERMMQLVEQLAMRLALFDNDAVLPDDFGFKLLHQQNPQLATSTSPGISIKVSGHQVLLKQPTFLEFTYLKETGHDPIASLLAESDVGKITVGTHLDPESQPSLMKLPESLLANVQTSTSYYFFRNPEREYSPSIVKVSQVPKETEVDRVDLTPDDPAAKHILSRKQTFDYEVPDTVLNYIRFKLRNTN